jgi:hypothetical protein
MYGVLSTPEYSGTPSIIRVLYYYWSVAVSPTEIGIQIGLIEMHQVTKSICPWSLQSRQLLLLLIRDTFWVPMENYHLGICSCQCVLTGTLLAHPSFGMCPMLWIGKDE